MQLNGGGRRSAVVLLLYTLTSGLSAAVCASAEEPVPDVSDLISVQLGAVSAESRALFVEVLDRLETMRSKMDGLKVDRWRLVERAERLGARVAKLEDARDCENARVSRGRPRSARW